ncbi:HU domain-containing protein [Pontibacter akesuensis]|nr:SPOR domain-containing protein [Pontibacter akesuensis]GHA58153.1 hypothetical protein GCM10007389_07500 [Pontibacter akesuensis]
MVEKHIKSLLYDHDCVIIPDFGGLIARYVPARINPVKHTLQPPSKTIAFNEKLVLNDGLLISTIAHQNNISKEEAQALVAKFVHAAKNALQQSNRFELSEIGLFRYSSEHRLVFEYVEIDNMLEESFGLPELVARPLRVEEPAVLRTLIKERQQELAEQKQPLPLRKRIKRAYHMAAGLALAGLSVSALYFLSLQANYNMSSLNPVMLFNGGNSAYAASPVDRYAADYVPFTEEERLHHYAIMLPEVAQPGIEESDAFASEEEIVVDSASMASDDAAEFAAAESVTEVAVVEEEEAKMPAHIVNANDGRFYIITGGYVRLENAEESRAILKKDGGDVKVVLPGPGSRLYRVAVADFSTKEEAQAELNTYRKKFGETLWVLTN